MSIRALIVDDEAPARERLSTLLADHPDVEIVGQCGNGPDAVDAIAEQTPDLVFLDVQMPEMSGFEVVDAVGARALPALVFVTAYDEFALRAFEARALDYLLKPFTAARFADTLDRARRVLAGDAARETRERVADLIDQLLPPLTQRRLAARDRGRVVFLRLQEIDWIEGAGNYVRLHASGRAFELRATLRATAARLHAAGFRRIHHSTIVNMERIRSVERMARGGFVVRLEDGTALETSRSYEESVARLL
ncbi:MAG TPA: response regulator [Gemmatimonadaceae bacterium]|nr:response regulator [Gemmatimonadaceae bacterium]